MVAEVDGRFRQAQIEADAYYEQQGRIAGAIEAEGVAEAKGITEMNKALQRMFPPDNSINSLFYNMLANFCL